MTRDNDFRALISDQYGYWLACAYLVWLPCADLVTGRRRCRVAALLPVWSERWFSCEAGRGRRVRLARFSCDVIHSRRRCLHRREDLRPWSSKV